MRQRQARNKLRGGDAMSNITRLIELHANRARKAPQTESGRHEAAFNAKIAMNLHKMRERGVVSVQDGIYEQVRGQAFDFVNKRG